MNRSAEEEPLEGFLQRIQPQLRAMLARHSIPPRDAEALLRDVFLTLVYKRDSIASPERWLLRNLRQRCLLFWKNRKWQLFSRLDAALVLALQESMDGTSGNPVVQELETVLATLPVACQGILRQRYGLSVKKPDEMEGSSLQVQPTIRSEDLETCLATLSKRLVDFGLLDDDASAAVH